MNDVGQFISSVGFPVFVAIYMLYKSSKDTEAMKDTISDLKNAITELTTLINITVHKKDGNDDENV